MNIINSFQRHIKRGQNEKALREIEKIIQSAPHISTSWFNYGICLNELARSSEAADAFLKAFELNPEDGGSLYRGCLALAQAHDLDALLKLFQDTCAKNPEMIYNFLEEKAFTEFFQRADFQTLKQQYAKQ